MIQANVAKMVDRTFLSFTWNCFFVCVFVSHGSQESYPSGGGSAVACVRACGGI